MHSKKTILHLIETVGPGGAETVFADILEYMKYNDTVYNHIAGFIKDGWIYHYVKDKNHAVALIKTGKYIDYVLIRNLVKFIKEKKISLIHSHLPDLSFYSSISARICGIPHIMTEHGDASNSTKNWKKLFAKYFIISLFSNKIICVSNYNRKNLKKRMPWINNKLTVIYSGIKNCGERNIILRKKIRDSLNVKSDEIALCNIANLYPVKGQNKLISAMKIVIRIYENVKLFVIGRGNLEKQLKEKVKDYGLDKSIIFLGFREDAKDILFGMDLFVLSSVSEGLPISIIEAMDVGLPIVATEVGGIPEFKELGCDIFLAPKDSKEKLAKLIIKVIRSGLFLSQKNIDIVNKYFSVNTMSSQYVEIYKNLI